MFWILAQAVAAFVGSLLGLLVFDEHAVGDLYRFFLWLRRLRS